MDNFFRKINLIDEFTIVLNTSRMDFIKALKNNVDEANINSFSSHFFQGFEVFSSSKNVFKGQVNNDGFKIRKRRRMFNSTSGLARAKGSFRERNDQLEIKTTVSSWNNILLVIICMLLVFYIVFISISFVNSEFRSDSFFVIPFLMIHGLFMLGIFYFLMRKSVKNLKQDLEREFVYIINKSKHHL